MSLDLVPIWTVILALSVFMYVLLDGSDLGLGVLFPFAPDDKARDTMMASIAPVWDGNETWLVMGGVGMFTAFPVAFAIIFPALYFPVLLCCSACCSAAWRSSFGRAPVTSRKRWDRGFFLGGSLAATFAQGCSPRKVRPRVRGERPTVRRLDLGLGASFRARSGRRAGVRLCAARRHLARHEDRGGAAGLGTGQGAARFVRRAHLHRVGERLDSVPARAHRRALVLVRRTCCSSRRCR